MRRVLPLLAVALVAGCGSSGPESAAPSAATVKKQLAGAPAPLARLHSQANELLDGGKAAFEARLEALRGYPIVVNKWGSWCGPCRAEFPAFQAQSLKRGKRVAFLGVNVQDSESSAKKFLAQYPVSYPSYVDGDLSISAALGAVQASPTTAFYDARGKLRYVHAGAYATGAKLAQDIDRYTR
jgi:cytochrome c biogenesis protein CcmG, thiol:disulfide interchange protein DsbE